MGYVYAALWFFIALILFLRFRSEGKVIIGVSIYFLFLGCWWLANQILPVDLMSGVYVWVLRGISAVVLGFCMFIYMKRRKRDEDE